MRRVSSRVGWTALLAGRVSRTVTASDDSVFFVELPCTPLVRFSAAAAIDRTAAGVEDLTRDRSVSRDATVRYSLSPHLVLDVVSTYRSKRNEALVDRGCL